MSELSKSSDSHLPCARLGSEGVVFATGDTSWTRGVFATGDTSWGVFATGDTSWARFPLKPLRQEDRSGRALGCGVAGARRARGVSRPRRVAKSSPCRPFLLSGHRGPSAVSFSDHHLLPPTSFKCKVQVKSDAKKSSKMRNQKAEQKN